MSDPGRPQHPRDLPAPGEAYLQTLTTPATADAYRSHLCAWHRWCAAPTPGDGPRPPRLPDQIDPTDPTPAQITAWAAYQATLHRDQRHRADDPNADRGLAPTTIRARLTVLAAYLDHTHHHDNDGTGATANGRRRRASGAVVRPALQQLEHDRPPDPPLAYLSAAQEAQAQAAAHRAGPLPHAIFALITLYGQPVSHLPRMTVADVDLTTDPPLLHTRPATAGTRRTVPLVGSALTALTDWLAVHPDPRPDAPLLATRHGHRPDQPARPLTRQAISKQLHSALADLQVPTDTPGQTRRPTLTDLRHTFAARCIAHGVTPEELKDYTGITWSGHQRGLRTPLTPPERRAAATGTTHPAAPPPPAEHPLTDHLTPTPRPRRIATRHYELLAGEDRARTALLHTAIQQIPDLLARALALPPDHRHQLLAPPPPGDPRLPAAHAHRMAAHAALHLTAQPADQQPERLTQLTAELTQRAHARTLLRTAASWPTDLVLPTPDQLISTEPTDPDEHRRLALELCLSLATPDHDPDPDTHALTDARDRTAHALHTPPAPHELAHLLPQTLARTDRPDRPTFARLNALLLHEHPEPRELLDHALTHAIAHHRATHPTAWRSVLAWFTTSHLTPTPTPAADQLLHHALLLTHHAATDPEADHETDGDDGAATGPSPAA